ILLHGILGHGIFLFGRTATISTTSPAFFPLSPKLFPTLFTRAPALALLMRIDPRHPEITHHRRALASLARFRRACSFGEQDHVAGPCAPCSPGCRCKPATAR